MTLQYRITRELHPLPGSSHPWPQCYNQEAGRVRKLPRAGPAAAAASSTLLPGYALYQQEGGLMPCFSVPACQVLSTAVYHCHLSRPQTANSTALLDSRDCKPTALASDLPARPCVSAPGWPVYITLSKEVLEMKFLAFTPLYFRKAC